MPAIDDSAIDFGLFDIDINKEAAGYDDGVEGDDHPDHPLPIDVQIYMDEEEEVSCLVVPNIAPIAPNCT